MKDDNKTNATDTMRDMTREPGEAIKKDYEQTKADMENVKDKAEDKMEDMSDGSKGYKDR
jgi:molecular chaperone GrpE (heat shock protein)